MRITVGYGDPAHGQARKLLRGSDPALGKQRSRAYPIDALATDQEALDWRKWTTGGCSFLPSLCLRSFERAVMP